MTHESSPAKASVARVRPCDFLYSPQLGRIECLKCGGRAFTRALPMIEAWERAHLLCCKMRDERQFRNCA